MPEKSKYGYERLNVGESLIVSKDKVIFRKTNANSVSAGASAYGKAHGKKFMTRFRPDGSIMVCRVA